jgi:hypothetical protein
MNILPLGRAYQNKELLFYNVEKSLPYIKKKISLARKYKILIEVRKFPLNFLEGFEYLINDPDDFIEEVVENDRMRKIFSNYVKNDEIMPCYKEWCSWCFFNEFCKKLIEYKKKINNIKNKKFKKDEKYIKIDRKTIKWILNNKKFFKKDSVIFYVENYYTVNEARRNYVNLKEFFKILKIKNLKLLNIPKCFSPYSKIAKENPVIEFDFLDKNRKISVKKFAKHFFLNHYYSKSIRCKACIYNKKCNGMHINYLRIFGFSSLKPIRDNDKLSKA